MSNSGQQETMTVNPAEDDADMHDLSSPNKRQRLNPESPSSHPINQPIDDASAQALINNPTIAASVLYVPGAQFPPLGRYLHRLIEVRVPMKFLYAKNKEVVNRAVWGSINQYTDDSDVIACLQHCGKYILRNSTPNAGSASDLNSNAGLSVLLRVSPPLAHGYVGSVANGIRSRSWKTKYHRYTISVVSVEHTDHVNTPTAHTHKSLLPQSAATSPTTRSSKQEPRQLKMVIVDRSYGMYGPGRTMNKQQRRTTPIDVTLRTSHLHTIWLAYSITSILDRGLDESTWTATRLRYQALELESVADRQRLRVTIHDKNLHRELFHPTIPSVSSMLFSLPPPQKQVAYDRYDIHVVDTNSDWRKPNSLRPLLQDLDWDDFQWSAKTVTIKGTVYNVDVYRWTPIDFETFQGPNVVPATQ